MLSKYIDYDLKHQYVYYTCIFLNKILFYFV